MCDGSCAHSDCRFCKIHIVVEFARVALGIVHSFALVCLGAMIIRFLAYVRWVGGRTDCQFCKIHIGAEFACVALGIVPLFALVFLGAMIIRFLAYVRWVECRTDCQFWKIHIVVEFVCVAFTSGRFHLSAELSSII